MKKILVIDDNEDILYALKEIIEYKDWEPFLANKVMDGIKIFKENDIDLVIIDYHMPVINGMMGVKKLRELSSEVPIIVLTVEENQFIADQFIEIGASDFALKPIKAPDLLSRLSVHLAVDKKNNREYKYVKGISTSTLKIVESYFEKNEDKITITKISKNTGLAYQTVHRYLYYMVKENSVEIYQSYGKIGRPKQYYRWLK
jgi:response regulator of citrate/malate metabolism